MMHRLIEITRAGTIGNLRSIKCLLPLRMLVTCFAICLTHLAVAQISYGGNPLEYGIEYASGLRSVVDYIIEMPEFDVDSIREIDDLPGNRIGGLGFAYTFFTDLTPENSGITFSTPNGTKVWKAGVRSKGAYSLNVLFSEFLLPDNAEVFIYNADRSVVLGAFTNKNRPEGGEFSIAPVEGDELTVEYHEPADAAFSGKIRISEVNHDYRGLFRAGTRFNQLELPCLPDVSCNPGMDTISRSVCLLIVNGSRYCTGSFVNNTAKDGKPYILTASHCLYNNASYGNRVVVFMNYQSPHCDSRIRGSEEFSLSGCVTRALSQEVDFALLELSELPPADYRPYLAGWTREITENKDIPFINIHHPYGEVKKYCMEEDSIVMADWRGNISDGIASGNHWNISSWETGHTWAGSSGSPLYDNHKRLRGCLTGGDSGGISGCGESILGDFFFRLDRAWEQFPDSSKQLRHWLDPVSPESSPGDISLDGMDPWVENPARRLSNILPDDSLVKAYLKVPYSGAMFGHNSLGTTGYAEHFITPDSSMLNGVYLMAAKGVKSISSKVDVNVYKGGEKPGTKLATAVLNPNYLEYSPSGESFGNISKTTFANRENYLRLEKPVTVGTDFYVGYEISYPLASFVDSFFVYAAIREYLPLNTAWFKSKQYWFPFTSHISQPAYASLWIEPIVMRDTISIPDTVIPEDSDTVNVEQPELIYSVQESTLYIWLPSDWRGTTSVEVHDLSGRLIRKDNISPPVSVLKFIKPGRNLYLIRLIGQGQTYTAKFMKY